MNKLKYLIIIISIFIFTPRAQALDINYGSVRGISGNTALVEYYGVENKQRFLCYFNSLICAKTKRTSYGSLPNYYPSEITRNKLKEQKYDYITLSPYKNFLAYYRGPTDTEFTREFIVQDVKTKYIYSLGKYKVEWDLISETRKLFDFLPDKKTIVYLNDQDGHTSIYMTSIDTKYKRVSDSIKLKTSGNNINNILVANANTLYYISNTENSPYIWSLYEYNLKTNKDKKIDDFISYTGPLYKSGNYIIYEHLENTGFGPKFYNMKTGKLSSFKIPGIKAKADLQNQEIINTDKLKGILLKPEDFDESKSYPLIIWLHGGPYRQSSYGYHPFHSYGIYDAILKLLSKNNVFILKLDYPGSSGFGRDYSESIKHNVGKIDVENVIVALDYIKTKYKINYPYIAGNSYGGYLALKTIVENPNYFEGAISINGVTDWENLLQRIKTSIFNVHFDGLPKKENQNLYDQASIINRINNLNNQKIIILQGEADRTVLPSQANLIYDKLKERNKNTTIITYPGEDHVFYKKKNITDMCGQLFKLVDKTPDRDC